MDWASIFLASAVPIVLIGGLINRSIITKETKAGNIVRGRGTGWQFIRFSVLASSVPVIGLLALNSKIDENIAYVLLAAGMGYAFGRSDD